MKIFTELLDAIQARLLMEKQAEISRKIKKSVDVIPVDTDRTDCRKMIDMKISEDGSVRTFVKGERYPIRAYPDSDTVYLTAYYKRFVPLILKSLAGQNWFQRVITILAIKYNFHILPEWFKYVFSVKPYLLKDECYCPAVKEVRRVLTGVIKDDLVDAIGLALEYDSAYKYVLQDMAMEYDRRNFNKNPIKEIERLFKLMISRVDGGGEEKFINILKFVKIYLFFNRKALKTIIEVENIINIEKILPSEEDYYWMLYLKVYNCFGMSEEERTKAYLQLKNETK